MYREKIENLCESFKGDTLVIEMVNDLLDSYATYIQYVVNMENAISVQKFRMEPEDHRELITNLDRNRRFVHNGIIAGTSMLNNICKSKSIEPLFNGDINDRVQIAEFAKAICDEMFSSRRM